MKNSVVITTYNGEKYIIEQLDSIRNQTLPPNEVIIRDDGSKDKTPQIIRGYIAKNGLKDWDFRVNEHNKGFFDNFVDAIRECSGDVIYLADQDDVWDKRKIETFTKLYDRHKNTTMIQSNMHFIDGNGDTLPSKELYHGKKMSDEPCVLTIEDMFKFAGSGYTMSFRKTVSDKVFAEGFDQKKEVFKFHDILLGQIAAVLGNCYLVTGIIDSHRLHSSNETQQNGKSYLAERTKKVQIDILARRRQQCRLMLQICKDHIKKMHIEQVLNFTTHRICLIEDRRFGSIKTLIMQKELYASKKGLITDLLYSLGFEKVLLLIYKVI